MSESLRLQPQLSHENAVAILRAPCFFCAYTGAGYWQRGTHHEQCLWRDVGGELDRLAVLHAVADALSGTRGAASSALRGDGEQAALLALVEQWRGEARKDHALRHDDDSGGIWAYQHEASGRSRKANQCADELEALIQSFRRQESAP